MQVYSFGCNRLTEVAYSRTIKTKIIPASAKNCVALDKGSMLMQVHTEGVAVPIVYGQFLTRFILISVLFVLASCSGGGGGGAPVDGNPPPQPPAPTQYTISGVVQGLAGTGLAIGGTGIQSLNIATNGPFTIPVTFIGGQSYQYVIYANPISPIQGCTVQNGVGTVSNANITNLIIDCKTIPARYANGKNWNDYVLNDGASFLQSSGTVCESTQAGGYSACLHAGEIREFELIGLSDCADLRIRDQLNAFDWVCVAGLPHPKAFSRGLKPDRGLSDLIDFDQAAWRPNSVVVNNGVADVYSTLPGIWWNNPIVQYSGSNVLSGLYRGSIFIMTSNSTRGTTLIFGGDNIALVIKPGIKLTFTPTTNDACAIHSGSRNFAWIEGEVNATGCGISLGFRSVVNNTKVKTNAAFSLHEGIFIWGGNDNLIRNVRINGFGKAVYNYFSQRNTFVNIDIRNAATGFAFYQARNHAISGVTFGDVTTTMISEDTNSRFNRLFNSTFVSWNAPVASDPYSTSLNNVVVNSQSVRHDDPSQAPFVGRIVTDDVANQSDGNSIDQLGPGRAVYENIGDWFQFANSYRGWGPRHNTDLICGDRAECQIWDLSIQQSDTTIRNVLPVPTGNDVRIHIWQVSQSTDPAATCASIVGARWDGVSLACTTTHLTNAVELMGDKDGNEDGFCQNNERCLYTPNIASYQGHGEIVEIGPFVNGTIHGVTLYQFSVNGR